MFLYIFLFLIKIFSSHASFNEETLDQDASQKKNVYIFIASNYLNTPLSINGPQESAIALFHDCVEQKIKREEIQSHNTEFHFILDHHVTDGMMKYQEHEDWKGSTFFYENRKLNIECIIKNTSERKDIKNLFLYYTGHGAPSFVPSSIQHHSEWSPSDWLYQGNIQGSFLQKYLIDYQVGNVYHPKTLIVTDACFSGGTFMLPYNYYYDTLKQHAYDSFKRHAKSPLSCMVMSSCTHTETSGSLIMLPSYERRGVFSQQLMNEVMDSKGQPPRTLRLLPSLGKASVILGQHPMISTGFPLSIDDESHMLYQEKEILSILF